MSFDILVVGAHMDDAELAAGGTIAESDDVAVIAVAESEARRGAMEESSDILGYEPFFGEIPEDEITEQRVVERLRELDVSAEKVFVHHQDDRHLHHEMVGKASRYYYRKEEVLRFKGPLGKKDVSYDHFEEFEEEALKKKMEALKVYEYVFGKTRYFTENYVRGEAEYLGQLCNIYEKREETPRKNGEIPYAEGFTT